MNFEDWIKGRVTTQPKKYYIRLTVNDVTDNEITITTTTINDVSCTIDGYNVHLINDTTCNDNVVCVTMSRGINWQQLRDIIINVIQPIKTFEIYDLNTYRGDIFFEKTKDIINLLILPKEHESMQRKGPNNSLFVAESQLNNIIDRIINIAGPLYG